MCNIGREYLRNPRVASRDLTSEEMKTILERDYDMLRKVDFFEFTGGEPFMRDDLVEMVKTVHTFLPKCGFWFPTNGTLPFKIEKDILKIIKIHGNVGASVSIDGNEKIHDKIRGVKGSFRKSVLTLKKLIKIREKYPWFNVMVSFTLLPSNIEELPFIYKLSRHFNVKATLRPLQFSPIYYKNVDNEDAEILGKYHFNKERLKKLVHFFDLLIQETFTSYKLAAFPHLYYFCNVLKYTLGDNQRRWSCFAGTSAFYLKPNGDVYACTLLDKRMGNLKEKSLREIWSSKKAWRIRDEIAKLRCRCWNEHDAYRIIEEDFIRLLLFSLKFSIKKMTHKLMRYSLNC